MFLFLNSLNGKVSVLKHQRSKSRSCDLRLFVSDSDKVRLKIRIHFPSDTWRSERCGALTAHATARRQEEFVSLSCRREAELSGK